MLVTGSWDRTLRFWDPRASTAQQSSHSTPERIYAIDSVNHTLVVGMASRLFHIYDIRKMDTVAQERESSLKYMTRSLACMPDGQGQLSFLIFFYSIFQYPVKVMQPHPWKVESQLNISTHHPPAKKRNTHSNVTDKPSTT